MSLILKVVASAALAAAALWTASSVPVTPAPPPVAWLAPSALAVRVADTLSTASAIGQIVAAPSSAPGLDGLVARGRVGRVEVGGGTAQAHLGRVQAWHDAAPFPVHVAAGGALGLPFRDAPDYPAPHALEAAARADFAYMTGEALAQASRPLAVQSPSTAVVLGDASASFLAGRTPIAASFVRGLRSGGVLPSARLQGAPDLDALADLSSAGLMEVRLAVGDEGDVATVRQIKEHGVFTGLVVAEVGPDAAHAVAALEAGADVVQSPRPDAAFDSLSQGARDGRLTADVLRDASTRVLSAKVWAGLDLAPPPPPAASEGVATGLQIRPWRLPPAPLVHRTGLLEGEVARRAVTVLQPGDGPLPFVGAAAPSSVLTVVLDPGADADRALPFVNALATGLAPVPAAYTRLGLGLEQSAYDGAVGAARAADVVVLAALPDSDGRLASRHHAVADQILGLGRTVVWVSMGPASLSGGLPPAAATVVGYQTTSAALTAAAQAVAGQIEVAGTLPVAVAGVAPAGQGVRLRQQALRPGAPEEVGLEAGTAERVDRVLEDAVRDGAFPGGAVAVGRGGVLLRLKGYGRLTRGGDAVTAETPYDLASLTKVVGTTTAAMQLVEDGRLDLDAEVSEYLPRYRGLGKEFVTVRQLLEHSAGQRPWYPFHTNDRLDRRAALDFIYADTLRYPPGTRSRYSDFDMIVLGEVLEAVTDTPLDRLLEERIYAPLGMASTGFRGVGVVDRTVAPTETDSFWRGRTLQGEVHDEAASVFGGVAGHAGLFSTASDLSRFAFVLSNGGRGYGTRLFRRTTLDAFTRHVRLPSTYPTGLGWMVNAGPGNSAAGDLSARTFGHTGFTGTSIWVDPESQVFVVLLTNRVHPSRRNRRIRDVRTSLATRVADAVRTPAGQAHTAWGFGPVPDDLAVLH